MAFGAKTMYTCTCAVGFKVEVYLELHAGVWEVHINHDWTDGPCQEPCLSPSMPGSGGHHVRILNRILHSRRTKAGTFIPRY
jgi:hypothetical protein